MAVWILWQQSVPDREINRIVLESGRRPLLIGVYDNRETPERLAAEFNKRNTYSVQTVTLEEVQT